jgi:hypothetical protein
MTANIKRPIGIRKYAVLGLITMVTMSPKKKIHAMTNLRGCDDVKAITNGYRLSMDGAL